MTTTRVERTAPPHKGGVYNYSDTGAPFGPPKRRFASFDIDLPELGRTQQKRPPCRRAGVGRPVSVLPGGALATLSSVDVARTIRALAPERAGPRARGGSYVPTESRTRVFGGFRSAFWDPKRKAFRSRSPWSTISIPKPFLTSLAPVKRTLTLRLPNGGRRRRMDTTSVSRMLSHLHWGA